MTCAACNGAGWVFIERNGLSAAERCPQCGPPVRPVAGVTRQECSRAVILLARANIAFFPADSGSQDLIVGQLLEMVNTSAELWWLVKAAASVITRWQGFGLLRGIFCDVGYHPRDGIYVQCELPGFNAPTPEQRRFEAEALETKQRLERYRLEAPRSHLGDLEPAGLGDPSVAKVSDLCPLCKSNATIEVAGKIERCTCQNGVDLSEELLEVARVTARGNKHIQRNRVSAAETRRKLREICRIPERERAKRKKAGG